MAEQNLASLFTKIAVISGKIGAIPKDAKHGQGYSYHSADAIMGTLNSLMAEHGLVIIPTSPRTTIEEGCWIIFYQFILCDAESGGMFVADWTGSVPMKMGQNLDDKALGKAHTYALKYWLMKLFMISTVDTDDLDKDDRLEQSKQERKQANKPAPPQQAKKQSTNPVSKLDPESYGLEGGSDTLALLKELTKPLYDNLSHQANSIEKLFRDGVLKEDMNADTAAAYVFMHRAGGKELGFNTNDVNAALGMTLKEFLKRNPRKYSEAWQKLHDYAKSLEMPE